MLHKRCELYDKNNKDNLLDELEAWLFVEYLKKLLKIGADQQNEQHHLKLV